MDVMISDATPRDATRLDVTIHGATMKRCPKYLAVAIAAKLPTLWFPFGKKSGRSPNNPDVVS